MPNLSPTDKTKLIDKLVSFKRVKEMKDNAYIIKKVEGLGDSKEGEKISVKRFAENPSATVGLSFKISDDLSSKLAELYDLEMKVSDTKSIPPGKVTGLVHSLVKDEINQNKIQSEAEGVNRVDQLFRLSMLLLREQIAAANITAEVKAATPAINKTLDACLDKLPELLSQALAAPLDKIEKPTANSLIYPDNKMVVEAKMQAIAWDKPHINVTNLAAAVTNFQNTLHAKILVSNDPATKAAYLDLSNSVSCAARALNAPKETNPVKQTMLAHLAAELFDVCTADLTNPKKLTQQLGNEMNSVVKSTFEISKRGFNFRAESRALNSDFLKHLSKEFSSATGFLGATNENNKAPVIQIGPEVQKAGVSQTKKTLEVSVTSKEDSSRENSPPPSPGSRSR